MNIPSVSVQNGKIRVSVYGKFKNGETIDACQEIEINNAGTVYNFKIMPIGKFEEYTTLDNNPLLITVYKIN